MKRGILDSEVFCELPSPGFFIEPPELRHRGRIPPQIRSAMESTWQQLWFAPRAVRICVLEDVFLTSEGLVFARSGEVINESITQHTEDEVERARAVLRDCIASPVIPRVEGEVVLCRKRGTTNYGHWLAEMLPRAWFATRHLAKPVRIMVQAVAGPLRAVMRESLALAGIAWTSCIEAGRDPVRVDRLILVDGLTAHGTYMSPLVPQCLQAIGSSILPSGRDRLFVIRGAAASRHFADEADIVAEAQQAGFAIFDPACVPFPEQVAAFKAARRVVGASGAALANLAFSGVGAEVLALAPSGMPDTFFWFIASLSRLRYIELRCEQVQPWSGPMEWDWNLRIDPDDLSRLFATLPPLKAPAAERLAELFDPAYYLAHNPDVATAGVDPLAHYMGFGWREGRNPSAAFDSLAYLRAYPDVAQAGFNPLLHYVAYGAAERRQVFPASGQ